MSARQYKKSLALASNRLTLEKLGLTASDYSRVTDCAFNCDSRMLKKNGVESLFPIIEIYFATRRGELPLNKDVEIVRGEIFFYGCAILK